MKQMTFADAEYAGKRKQTRKELFLIEMGQVVPWKGLIALIEPHYPKGEGGRPAYPLMAMLRIYLMQNWFGYSDPAMEEALYETTILRQFAGLSLERIPDETTILNFRRLLEKHELAAGILGVINGYLGDRGLSLRQGTIVDATLINAPSSTKNKDGKRDPEMHQTKKGNQYYFGMKAHIGVDDESGLVHSVVGTAANVADVTLQAQPRELPQDGGLVQCLFHRRIAVAKPVLHQMNPQHRHQRIGRTSAFTLGVVGLDQGNQTLPWHYPIHFDQEQLFAGLLALAGVLGVGEGHLLHGKTRLWDRRISPDSGSLFQTFLKRLSRRFFCCAPGMARSAVTGAVRLTVVVSRTIWR